MPMENYGSVYKNIPEDGAVDNLNLARDDESVDDYESEKDSFPVRVKLFNFNSDMKINSYKLYRIKKFTPQTMVRERSTEELTSSFENFQEAKNAPVAKVPSTKKYTTVTMFTLSHK